MKRPVLSTLFFVLGTEALLAGGAWLLWATSDEDPLKTVTVSKQWIGRLYGERAKEQAEKQEMLQEIQRLEKALESSERSRST